MQSSSFRHSFPIFRILNTIQIVPLFNYVSHESGFVSNIFSRKFWSLGKSFYHIILAVLCFALVLATVLEWQKTMVNIMMNK